MKLRTCLLGMLLIGIVGCGTSVPKSEDWTTFKSPAGYSVSMPSKPKKQSQSADGQTIDMYLSEVGKYFAVMTMAINMPAQIDIKDKELVKTMLDNSASEFMGSLKGKVTEQKNVTIAGKYPAKEFTGTFDAPGVGKSVMRGRVILTKKALISLNVAGTDEFIKLPQAQKCLDSVKID